MQVTAQALTGSAFEPFGQVIESAGNEYFMINADTCRRHNDLAVLDLMEGGGRPCVSIFRARPLSLPLRLRMLERHPLSSQAFIPLQAARFLVVVAPPGESVELESLRAFFCAPGQGINYDRGVWHHPLIALNAEGEFLVLDRSGPGHNCDEHYFAEDQLIKVVA